MGPGTETVFLMIKILALQTVYLLALPISHVVTAWQQDDQSIMAQYPELQYIIQMQ